MEKVLDPLLLSSLDDDDAALPTTQPHVNAAILAVFAYLVPLLTMEINFFRLAVYKSWRRRDRESGREKRGGGAAAAAQEEDGIAAIVVEDGDDDYSAASGGNDNGEDDPASLDVADDGREDQRADCRCCDDDDDDIDGRSSSSSAVGHLVADARNALPHNDTSAEQQRPTTTSLHPTTANANDPTLQRAYDSIRRSSAFAVLSSLAVYGATAVGIASSTRGLDPKVVAVIVGCGQFFAALMIFIVSAKVPQWIGVYHQGSIRLVKCSSDYSRRYERIDLEDDSAVRKLGGDVRLGVWFHFSKFYIVTMPFYCGVMRGVTIPLSIFGGAIFGFVLMWAVFVVHEKYIHHRNIVSFTTIIFLSILSGLLIVRGMAWIQVVWKLNILKDEDLLLVISFFAWLGLLALVHALFIWHTLRTEESNAAIETGQGDSVDGNDAGGLAGVTILKPMGRTSSYSSFVFDPRTHFMDGKCQFSKHPDLEDDLSTHNDSTDAMLLSDASPVVVVVGDGGGGGQSTPLPVGCEDGGGCLVEGREDLGHCIETPVVADVTGDGFAMKIDNDVAARPNGDGIAAMAKGLATKRKRCPSCRGIFVCYSPEYKQSSCLWKFLIRFKIITITISYLLCLYFVIVCIGATYQISTTRAGLPAVHEALYNHMNEGMVCAFDNRGPDSNITTFKDEEAAHDAGFLVVHCGACGACSNWENLIVEWTTRNNMAELANQCAKEAFFGGGDDATTACLMKPEIGFGHDCAVCWMEDIMCTKDHCAFLFLQSQITNSVGNFAVGKDDITSASCEEAHCEVGQFVPCSGATRRRMNITSSISRSGAQQCEIVDVKDWEDLFFGSGVA